MERSKDVFADISVMTPRTTNESICLLSIAIILNPFIRWLTSYLMKQNNLHTCKICDNVSCLHYSVLLHLLIIYSMSNLVYIVWGRNMLSKCS